MPFLAPPRPFCQRLMPVHALLQRANEIERPPLLLALPLPPRRRLMPVHALLQWMKLAVTCPVKRTAL